METETMGRVIAEVTIENLRDRWAVEQGTLSSEQVRRVTVSDALADTGATMLSLPTRLIRQLGLIKTGSRRIRSTTGIAIADVYGDVWITIQGRDSTSWKSGQRPVLIGQIPLERLILWSIRDDDSSAIRSRRGIYDDGREKDRIPTLFCPRSFSFAYGPTCFPQSVGQCLHERGLFVVGGAAVTASMPRRGERVAHLCNWRPLAGVPG